VTVLIGELAGHRSPAPAYTPLVGAQLRLPAGAEVEVPLDPGFEHGLLAVDAGLSVDGRTVAPHELAHLGSGRTSIRLSAPEGDALVLLLGGAPFEERLVMWWNFVARSHEEIVEQREAWNGKGVDDVPQRFGRVLGLDSPRLLAPPLPNVRLRPR
jgi:redox-sensitive bicupin YhaK (pirin superfamily)